MRQFKPGNMKKLPFFIAMFLFFGNAMVAQVGINTDNSAPDGASMLDVKSTSRGMLIPRMTIAQRDAITSPAKGLMVFCTDNSQYYYNAGTPASKNWVMMNTQWLANGTSLYFNGGNVGIGTTDPGQKLSVAGQLGLLETDATPVYYTALQSGNISSPLTFTLPNGYGSSGQVLTTNGSGVMSWSSAESPLTVTNGLTRLISTVKWGGSLTESTTITQPGSLGLNFVNSGTANTVFNLTGTGDFDVQDNGTSALYVTHEGKVGIGTMSPTTTAHIKSNTGNTGFTSVLQVENISITSSAQQVHGIYSVVNHSTPVNAGAAVMGWSTNSAGGVMGIWGESGGENGYGVYGRGSHSSGINYGICGKTSSPNGFAGYFLGGKNYFEGNVGINTTNPNKKLTIIGDFSLDYGTAYGNGVHVTGTTSLALAYFENYYAGNTWALSAGCGSSSAGSDSYGLYAFNYGTGYAAYGVSYDGIGAYGKNSNANNYGYLGSVSYGVYGSYGGTNYGYIGGSAYGVYGQYGATGNYGYLGGSAYASYAYNQASGNYGHIGGSNYALYGYLTSTNVGDYAIYGYGVHIDGVDGTGYGNTSSLGSVKGFNYYGNPYTFGVAGYSFLDDNRSGATFGGWYSGSAPWGCLAYKNSAGTSYGGYFTSYTTGTGKSSGVLINSGIGAWGDLFGADIHGKVYGAYMEGSDYGAYVNGDSFKNGLDVHLQKESEGKNIPLYTHVSTEMTIQTCGYASLSDGTCRIEFDPSFTAAVSSSSPVIVTVTPMGKTEGVYLSEVSPAGFSVAENHDGKSSVQVSYIAVGKRAGYENPVLPEAVVAGDYVDKLNAGLHNDADTETDGRGLYYENGKLYTGKHPSTLPDPNKPATDPNIEQAALPVQGQMTKPDVQKHPDRGTGAAPQKATQKTN